MSVAIWFIWTGLVLAQLPGLKAPASWWWLFDPPKWRRVVLSALALAIGAATFCWPLIPALLARGAF